MTAPDMGMENLIAEVLAGHLVGGESEGMGDFTFLCTCGYDEGIGSDWEEAGKLIAAHQARAVLQAISEAGTVEWGIRYGDGDIDGGYLYKSEALTDIARLRERVRLGFDSTEDHEPMTLLTHRRAEHATEWVSAE